MTTIELHNTSSAEYQIDKENSAQMLALDLVSKTNASFFLTGKAGTGKTTFRHYIQEHVKKNFVIVAPTGVAAIVVGGISEERINESVARVLAFKRWLLTHKGRR